MADENSRLIEATLRTVVVRPPQQKLATFGTTSIRYYLVTEPVYADLDQAVKVEESVIREGIVRADRPEVVTPYYLLRHEGFAENASRFLQEMLERYGDNAPGLLYTYKNERMETSVVSGAVQDVASRIGARLDKEQRSLEAVICGVDALWDVSLMKFIYDLTCASLRSNVSELHNTGMLEMTRGVPRNARVRIERMMDQARSGGLDPSEIHMELERWGMFDEYQDRFLGLFGRR